MNDYIAFQLGNNYFSLPLDQLEWVIPTPKIRQVPNAPPFYLGVIDEGEQMVPVLYLREVMGLPGEDQHPTFLLLFEKHQRLLAFGVDKIFDNYITDIEPKKDFTYIPDSIHRLASGTHRVPKNQLSTVMDTRKELNITVLSTAKIYHFLKKEAESHG